MKKIVLDKILATVAGGMFIWNAGLGDIVEKYVTASSDSTVKLGCYVPITRSMTTTNGAKYGHLYNLRLVEDNNSRASYESASLKDTDLDGVYDWEEDILGTDPKDPKSTGLETKLEKTEKETKIICTPRIAGRTYEIYRTENLTEGFGKTAWKSITSPTGEIIDTNKSSKAYYKVNVIALNLEAKQ